jgi:hypothetical protein
MYDIKKVINKMKQIANIDSNASLARLLNISYNTLNTWIKRHKLPQEVILSFCKKYNCSLDYLLLEDNNNPTLFINNTIKNNNETSEIYSFIYYGDIKNEQNFNKPLELTINTTLMHSNSYYLLNKENIYLVAKCSFDIFDNIVYIENENITHKISLDNFKEINRGLITNIAQCD